MYGLPLIATGNVDGTRVVEPVPEKYAGVPTNGIVKKSDGAVTV
jgi:hypothetical protein